MLRLLETPRQHFYQIQVSTVVVHLTDLIIHGLKQSVWKRERAEFDRSFLISWKNSLQVLVGLLDDLELRKLTVLNVFVLFEVVENGLSLQVLERSRNEEAFANLSKDFLPFNQVFNRVSQLKLVNLKFLSELCDWNRSSHTSDDASHPADFSLWKCVGDDEIALDCSTDRQLICLRSRNYVFYIFDRQPMLVCQIWQ